MASVHGGKGLACKRPRHTIEESDSIEYDQEVEGAYGECLTDPDLHKFFVSVTNLLSHTSRELTMEEQRQREKDLLILTVNHVAGIQSCRTARKNKQASSNKNKKSKDRLFFSR